MVSKYRPLLEEGSTYKITFLTVFPNTGSYKATSHENRVVFSYKTVVSPLQIESIPLNGLSLLPCSEVLKQTSDNDVLVGMCFHLYDFTPLDYILTLYK